MKKFLGILVLGLFLFSSGAYSMIYEGEFKLNRNLAFKLPQGKWQIVKKYSDGYQGLRVMQKDLVLLDGNQIKGVFSIGEIDTGGWRIGLLNQLIYSMEFQDRYDGCYKRYEYYLVKVYKKGSAINCLIVRHIDWQKELYQPDDPEQRTDMALWKHFIKSNNLKSPSILLYSRHVFYAPSVGNKYIQIIYIANPELYGASKNKFTTEETSEYHSANINQYPDKKKFMEDWVKIAAQRHKDFEKAIKVKSRYKLDLREYVQGEIIEEIKTTSSSSGLTEELKELNKLYEDGVLTEEEFKKAKKKVLSQ